MKQILDKAFDILLFFLSVVLCVLLFFFIPQWLKYEAGVWHCLCLLLCFFVGYFAWRMATIIVKQDISNENGEDVFILEEYERTKNFKTKHPFLHAFDKVVNRISFWVTFILIGILCIVFLWGPIGWLLKNDYTIQLENTDPLSLFVVLLGGVMMLVLLLIFLYVIVVHAMSQYARSIKEDVKKSIQDALSQDCLKIKENTRDLSDKLDSFK